MFDNFSFAEMREMFQQRTQRERLMILLVLGAALYFLFDFLVFRPQTQRTQALLDSQQSIQSQVVALSAQLASAEQVANDNLEQRQLDYQRLKKQVDLLDAMASSVTPDAPHVRSLISEILGAQKTRISPVAVKTLPVKMLVQGDAKGASSVQGAVYRHGVDIELHGSYLDLLTYLRSLEDAHPKLYWSNATLNAGTYPENTMKVSLFLLSAQSKQ